MEDLRYARVRTDEATGPNFIDPATRAGNRNHLALYFRDIMALLGSPSWMEFIENQRTVTNQS